LSSVGVEADDARIAKLLKELEGKNIEDVIKAGQSKLAAVPAAGPAAAAPAAGGAGKPAAAAAAPAKEEPKEEEESAMAFDLFD
jgi:large subunit ribosomal protein LP2